LQVMRKKPYSATWCSTNIRITGPIDSIYGKEFIGYSVSDYPLKYRSDAYIKTLFLLVEGKIESARFIDKNGFVSKVPGDQKTANFLHSRSC